MGLAFTVRKYHKWLSLIVGVQALIWLASGAYMVVVNIDYIHGDHLVRNMQDPLPVDRSGLKTFGDMQARFPEAREIRLTTWMGEPHYRVRGPEGYHLVDAASGDLRPVLREEEALAVAHYHYARERPVANVVLLTKESPPLTEFPARLYPVWKIRFDDFGSSTFYVSPDGGHLITRRHTFWRIFDFVWMLHIMDYDERADVNNNLFRVAATLGLVMSIFGLWLAYYSFKGRKKNANQSAEPRSGGVS